jgi:hypothetical protein
MNITAAPHKLFFVNCRLFIAPSLFTPQSTLTRCVVQEKSESLFRRNSIQEPYHASEFGLCEIAIDKN